MTQEINSKQTERICKSLRQIANTLEGNKNAEIQAFFIKVVRTFAEDNVLFFNENAFGNDFVEWQVIERKESVFEFYENSRICVEKPFLYLQKNVLDSSTQPVEIAKIPTNFSFSEMINFCTYFGLIDILTVKFSIQSKIFEYYFTAIVDCTTLDNEIKEGIIISDKKKCFHPFKLVSWQIFEVNENPYVKKLRLDVYFNEKETIQISQIPTDFSFQELVTYCLFLGIVN